MKRKKIIDLLRLKAVALTMVGVISLSGCGDSQEGPRRLYKYKGYIYLVPYQNHLYVVIDEKPEDDHVKYEYKVIGYEGGTNKHYLEFYKNSGSKFGDKWHASEVFAFNPNDEEQMEHADELLEEYGQESLSDKLPKKEETTTNIVQKILKKEEID